MFSLYLYLSVIEVKPRSKGASFDVVAVLDPLSHGIVHPFVGYLHSINNCFVIIITAFSFDTIVDVSTCCCTRLFPLV